MGAEIEVLSYGYFKTHKASMFEKGYAGVALVNYKEHPVTLGLTYAVGKEL